MNAVTNYDDFYTIDELTNKGWRRDIFFPTTEEVGLLLLQDTSKYVLDIGLVIGNDERDALNQVNYPSFDESLGDSEILRALSRLLKQDQLLPLMIHTAKERGKFALATKGNMELAFEKAVYDIFKSVGFTEEAGILKMDV